MAAILMYGGSEEIVVRGETLEALQRLATVNEWREHPRLRRLTITGLEGVIERHPAPKAVAP